ncbi:acyl-CoA Delta(11) desaturase [Folsomia candida]|uniref:Acyl-CoA Delta(11) desaturase n=1 Tax=Folsomia candida TaxID=158441 RepID=A0A226EQ94_FOLCA|nr:acyl-CoA Delta(11) desaturase [Folsomia candida]OXA58991.1 Acyl-CoA Delta(11) desaturase [Folsomia candida]
MCYADTLTGAGGGSGAETRIRNKDEISSTENSTSSEFGEFGLKKFTMREFVPFHLPMHVCNIFLFLLPGHVLGIYGFYLIFTGQTPYPWWNLLFSLIYGYAGGIGVTAGTHRLWTHRSYKANTPLQVLLMLMQTSSLQYPVIKWCRDHRIHHKYTDTNADPHNAARGFWFSHMGWLLEPEHPDVAKKEKTIPMQDLENNPVLEFQVRYYLPLAILTAFVIPISITMILFPQPFFNIFCGNYTRWIMMLHTSACVNSVAHFFGSRPYDKDSSAVDNKILAIFTVGEAWHNFHHCFPTDYKTSELPFYSFNLSTAFIDFFAWVGWATDLKTVSKEAIQRRMERTGDGSGLHHHHHYAIEESESELSSDENLDEDVFNNNNGEAMSKMVDEHGDQEGNIIKNIVSINKGLVLPTRG